MRRQPKYSDEFIRREAVALLQYARTVPLPLEYEFCEKRKYSSTWVTKFAERSEVFAEALARFKDIQRKQVIFGAITNKINCTFAIFMMKNVGGWRDNFDISGKGFGETKIVIINNLKKESDSRIPDKVEL